MTRDRELESLEVDLLLQAIRARYGFDFSGYARASLLRRIRHRMASEGLATVSALQDRVLHDRDVMERLLLGLSINVTDMFRDPPMFLQMRRDVVPMLRTWPFIRLWVAGCSTGEEVYSLAILLHEEGLLERARVYATDMNEVVVDRARAGVYPLERMRDYTRNYQAAGGTGSFSECYTAKYDRAILGDFLRKAVVFSAHNLATGGRFNDFHLILCCNVMIYFDQKLQARVYDLLHDSLVPLGVLGIGQRESLRASPHADCYERLGGSSLYRRRR